MNEHLQAFLYILMRDEVTPGKVEKIMEDLRNIKGRPANYDEPHLSAYAKALAGEILSLDDLANAKRMASAGRPLI